MEVLLVLLMIIVGLSIGFSLIVWKDHREISHAISITILTIVLLIILIGAIKTHIRNIDYNHIYYKYKITEYDTNIFKITKEKCYLWKEALFDKCDDYDIIFVQINDNLFDRLKKSDDNITKTINTEKKKEEVK